MEMKPRVMNLRPEVQSHQSICTLPEMRSRIASKQDYGLWTQNLWSICSFLSNNIKFYVVFLYQFAVLI